MMEPATRGLLLLACLGLLVCLFAGLSTAEVTDAYIGDREGNRNATVLLGGDPLTVWASVHGEVMEYDVGLDSPLVDLSRGRGGGTDRSEEGTRLHYGFPLLPDSPPGEHVFTFTLNYTLWTNESFHYVLNMTANLVQAIELVDVRITSGLERRLELEVRIYIPCDSVNVEYDSDGSIMTSESSEYRGDLAPGTYVFSTGLDRAIRPWSDDADEVGYFITAVFGNQTIELIEMNIDPNTLTADDGGGLLLMAVVAFVVFLLVLSFIVIRRRRRPRTSPAPPVPGARLRPPA